MKKIGLLGSTGSIGVQTLNIIRELPNQFSVKYLSAHDNVKLLVEQSKEFKPDIICIVNESHVEEAKQELKKYNIEILHGINGLNEISKFNNIDIALNAIVGSAGMRSTYNIVSSNIDLALANKESLVMAGKLIMDKVNKSKSNIFPVDSEHSAIWQCLVGENIDEVEKIILTGSGGPFRQLPLNEFKNVTLNDALNHPNWEMGKKISIDSATMMNKGLEFIEACWLFNMNYKMIDIIVHPQSIIHSMVEFVDGSVKAQLGLPNMTIPIQYAMTYPHHISNNTEKIKLSKIKDLTFEEPDLTKFPCIKLAYEAQKEGGTYPTVLNIANDLAVEAFINNEIQFLDIYKLINIALDKHNSMDNFDLDVIDQIYSTTFNFMKEQIKCLH